ncbi:aminotransferase class V [Virgisporangium aliadipatigenens]|uniref:Aminotransferase class V n=1 Tax=Virgisporangium aliadipatigenens TaxID=741659 RepID=A0A8J3YKT0_9ACTN|nr:aminotransferase class V-fold PLP-dependent enzyme [Virgisporangium aliadipatigenens]GIJ45800.1 aminotransferase class V [Virgisporangium aliadipatigenens]
MPQAKPPDPIPGARLLFSLDPGVSHLNHGSFGAVPVPVQRAQQRLRDEMDANPMRFFTAGLHERVAHARRHLAAFLRTDSDGTEPEGSALVANATTAASIVLDTLRLKPGDEIVSTDHGYGAVSMAIARSCRESGAVSRVVPVPLVSRDEDVVDAVRAAVTSRTRLVIIDQITSPTARVLPVRALIKALRGTGVAVFVDAAHAPGSVDAVPGADFWVGNLHKWAFAPRGTALLSVAERWRGRIRVPVVSWEDGTGFPGALEGIATTDYTGWLAAPVGLFVLRTLGVAAVRRHNADLAAYGQQVVGAALGLDPGALPEPGGDDPIPMRIVPLPARTCPDYEATVALRQRISDELLAEVAINFWNGRGYLRLSGQVYNRAEEYERLAERLPALLRHM